MIRFISAVLFAVTMVSVFAGCAVTVDDQRRCPNGWEPEHRDREGRLVGGHCR